MSGRIYRGAVRFLAGVGLLFLLVVFTPFVSWYAGRLAAPWSSEQGDVMVVLSASDPNSGVMSLSTYWRCFMGLVYYREHPFREIIVSGKASAPGMKDFFVFNGVPAERIRVEDKSSNTHENAEYTAAMLPVPPGRVVLITSDDHVFRARRCFARLGVRVTTPAVPDVVKRAADRSARPQLFVMELNETAAIVYYRFRGWI